jgi:GYD domain
VKRHFGNQIRPPDKNVTQLSQINGAKAGVKTMLVHVTGTWQGDDRARKAIFSTTRWAFFGPFLYAGNKSRTRAAFAKHPEDRTAAVKALVEKLGGRFEAFYYSFGEYDGIVVLEAPDEATATAFALAAVASELPRALLNFAKRALP